MSVTVNASDAVTTLAVFRGRARNAEDTAFGIVLATLTPLPLQSVAVPTHVPGTDNGGNAFVSVVAGETFFVQVSRRVAVGEPPSPLDPPGFTVAAAVTTPPHNDAFSRRWSCIFT